MRIHRGGPAVAGLALCLGALTACGGSSGPSAGDPRPSRGADHGFRAHTGVRQGRRRALDGKVVVIDPGHNGGNADHPSEINKQVKIGNGSKACDTTGTETKASYAEHAFTWDVSKRLASCCAPAAPRSP